MAFIVFLYGHFILACCYPLVVGLFFPSKSTRFWTSLSPSHLGSFCVPDWCSVVQFVCSSLACWVANLQLFLRHHLCFLSNIGPQRFSKHCTLYIPLGDCQLWWSSFGEGGNSIPQVCLGSAYSWIRYKAELMYNVMLMAESVGHVTSLKLVLDFRLKSISMVFSFLIIRQFWFWWKPTLLLVTLQFYNMLNGQMRKISSIHVMLILIWTTVIYFLIFHEFNKRLTIALNAPIYLAVIKPVLSDPWLGA